MATVYLGLGSNQGDREANLREGVRRLSPEVMVEVASSLYEAEPVGYKEQPWFLNAVVRASTELSPQALLAHCQRVERALGRKRSFRNAPRPLDIDILFYDDLVLDTPDLVIPHPRLHERAFVLIPLNEIAPWLQHPKLGAMAGELLARGQATSAGSPSVPTQLGESAKRTGLVPSISSGQGWEEVRLYRTRWLEVPLAPGSAWVKARYDRIASRYDLWEAPMEWLRFARWRRRLWQRIGNLPGGRVLEVGVGTGKNMPFYLPGCQVTAIDLSPRMLAQAQKRANGQKLPVGLALMEAERLALDNATFDTVVATFVFCSVADPVVGLRELGRVCRPGGHVLLLEHVRSRNRLLGRLMDWLDPVVYRWGPGDHINRPTVDNIRAAGLEVEEAVDLAPTGLVQLIVACPQ